MYPTVPISGEQPLCSFGYKHYVRIHRNSRVLDIYSTSIRPRSSYDLSIYPNTIAIRHMWWDLITAVCKYFVFQAKFVTEYISRVPE